MSEINLQDKYIFGLDIGTRSIVGIVGYKTASGFRVVADCIVEHDSRVMIDGQIHDINKVSHTINRVKNELELQIGFPLKKVCIAAAGRVLKTKTVHVEQDIDPNVIIDEDRISALELLGIEKAYQEINTQLGKTDLGFHCVGYTVTKYYLNDYEIINLIGHKGKKISADVLATFLPNEVIDSLYQVIQNANMQVKSLTLEPIAAIQIAIPNNFRLLNIALVDIGAGTSDIAITKDGSIIAYGMIPMAGDEITEAIVHKYLVDFKTAEKIKIKSSSKCKVINYKDIMGLNHKIDVEDVLRTTKTTIENLAKKISDKIIELNGGHATNAVFIVGGGGRVKNFTKYLAKYLGLPNERVALRGKSVLDIVEFETKTKKSPELVTPVGICFTGMEQKNYEFIQVFLNDEPLKVFDTNNLTVMDIAALKGFDPKKLIATRGKDLIFTFNGVKKVIKGDVSAPAKIMIGNRPASLNDKVSMNDYITIIPAKNGKDASMSINELYNELPPIQLMINGKYNKIVPELLVNGKSVPLSYNIKYGDVIQSKNPTLKEVFVKLNIFYKEQLILVNNRKETLNYLVNNNDIILLKENIKNIDNIDKSKTISIQVNGKNITMNHKKEYVFVDVFDFINFDLSKPRGNIICEINGKKATYMEKINNGDVLKIYWSNDEL